MAATPEIMKNININLIYKVLVELLSATRQEIAEKTGISLTTIRAVLEELLEKNKITETQFDESSGGRRAQRYALNSKENMLLLFYFSGNRVIYQIADLNGRIIKTDEKEFCEKDIMLFVGDCLSKWKLLAVGIGVHGVVENGKVYSGCDINRLSISKIGEEIEAKYKLPVVLENEINALAYGYSSYYLSRHGECSCDDLNITYIYFGNNGVKAGLVTDGKIIRGASHFAGELGFMPISESNNLSKLLSSRLSLGNSIDMLCRTIAVISCVANPALVVLGGDMFDFDHASLEQIKVDLKRHYLSDAICPEIIAEDDHKQKYLFGLKRLTINHVLKLLPF